MEVDLGVQICKNNKENERGRGKVAKSRVEGKMKSRVGIYRAQNIHCYATAKGSTQRQSMFRQRHRDLHYCVPESGKRVTQRRKVLRCCVPES